MGNYQAREMRRNREIFNNSENFARSLQNYWEIIERVLGYEEIVEKFTGTGLHNLVTWNYLATCKITFRVVAYHLKLSVTLKSKWNNLLPAEDNLDSELARWKSHCSRFSATLKDKSMTHLLSEEADPIFFPNIQEFLCILAILPIGSTEQKGVPLVSGKYIHGYVLL